MLIRNAELLGVGVVDVQIEDGRIRATGAALERRNGEAAVDALGGALLPGLHDHHIHLFALAAALESLRCGPPEVTTSEQLSRLLRRENAGWAAGQDASPGDWLRGVGYFESVAGPLDRWVLDRWVPDRPVRIQHRSGALWILNSAAVKRLQLENCASPPPGLERDERGRVTGRLFRLDSWLRGRMADRDAAIPSLAATGRMLSRLGVTGVTDATPTNGANELRAFDRAVQSGELQQQLLVMGRPELPQPEAAGVRRGAVKIMLDEVALPGFETLEATISAAHEAERNIAIHCVTRAELVFALSALGSAGSRAGDRIEHASVSPPDLVGQLASLGLTVVTQPNFISERGDAYAVEVEPRDREWLYRGAGFVAGGVPLAGGTDAPFGAPDPWLAMRAAVTRRSANGIMLGSSERLEPEAALALFTTPLEQPGGRPRRIDVGEPADLCLLDRPWAAARSTLSSDSVRATLRAGHIIWQQS